MALQAPRFRQEAFYTARDARQLAAKERSPTGGGHKNALVYKNALIAQPHLEVKDPLRPNVTFRSTSARFTSGGPMGDILGLHPNFIRT